GTVCWGPRCCFLFCLQVDIPEKAIARPRAAKRAREVLFFQNSWGISDAWLLVHNCEQHCGRPCGSESAGFGAGGDRLVDESDPPPQGTAVATHVPDLLRADQTYQPRGRRADARSLEPVHDRLGAR